MKFFSPQDVYQQFYFSIFGVPLYLLALAFLVFELQQRRVISRSSKRQAAAAPLGAKLTLKRRIVDKLTQYYGGSELRYLKLAVIADPPAELEFDVTEASPNPMAARPVGTTANPDEDEDEAALRLWWKVSTVALTRKMASKQLVRTLLEVSMFVYMGVAKKATSALWCVTVNGEGLAAMDPAVRCDSGQHLAARLTALLVLCGFTLGFPVYIIWKLQHLKHNHHHQRSSSPKAAAGEWAAGSVWKPGRFTTMVRVAYIFQPSHRWWMAFLLLRRFFMVLFYLLGQTYGGLVPVPGTGGGHVEWRTFPFFMLILYVLVQSWNAPFDSRLDNQLEQTTLAMLITVLYADISLTAEVVGGTVIPAGLTAILLLSVRFQADSWGIAGVFRST